MSQYSKTNFAALYGDPAGPFNNTTTNTITGVTLQTFANDVADSMLFSDSFMDTDRNFFEGNDWLRLNFNFFFTDCSSGASSGWVLGTYGVDGTEKAMGVLYGTTGTTATGQAGYYINSGSLVFGFGHAFRLRGRNALVTLSTVTERFTKYWGFGDTNLTGDMVDGAYFRYVDNVNSGKWECVTSLNSVRTVADSGVTAVTTYSIFEVRVNSTGTSVAFYIDGALVATNTTNIPNTLARATGILYKIEKSIGTSGTDIAQDWYDLTITRASAR